METPNIASQSAKVTLTNEIMSSNHENIFAESQRLSSADQFSAVSQCQHRVDKPQHILTMYGKNNRFLQKNITATDRLSQS